MVGDIAALPEVGRSQKKRVGGAMSEDPDANDERPCLDCLIGDLIDEFYAEYGSLSGE